MKNFQSIIFNGIVVAAVAAAAFGCGRDRHGNDPVAAKGRPVTVERFDSVVALYETSTSAARDSMRLLYAPVFDMMSRINSGRDADSVICEMGHTRYFEVFFPDVISRIGPLDRFESDLGTLRELLPAQVDSLRFPSRVFGIVTPYDQSVMLYDTIMLVGLNHYLGSDYEGYAGFDEYRRRLKTLSRAPIDVAEALIYSSHPFDGSASSTALQRMVYEGAVVAAVSRALPDRSLAEVLGYTPEQMQWLEDNESEIWRKMVADGLLYSHDRATAERLVLPAPFTSVISRQSPGRSGRYIGFRIVESYLKNNPGSSVSDLLDSNVLRRDDLLVRAAYRSK